MSAEATTGGQAKPLPLETIVVPLDDATAAHATAAQRALRTAFAIAARTMCEVSLVRACPPDEADEVGHELLEAGERFRSVAPFSTRVLEGPPVDAVLNAAAAETSMICMRTHGRSGLSRLVFGSVAEDLIRHSTQPILCVGPGVTDIVLPKESIEVLVCIDDSSASVAVVDGATAFAERVDAHCVVSQVVGPDEEVATSGDPAPRPIRDEAEHRCQQAAEQLESDGIAASAHVLHGATAKSIVEQARRRAASFIVVGTSSRTGFDRFALGSVAVGVVRHAHCPVLVVPTHNRLDR